MKTLSLVVPCYNESSTLANVIDQVLLLRSSQLNIEILIVEDCSSDNSLQIAQNLSLLHPEVKTLHHTVNAGKGAALRTGFVAASGDYIGIQDADLEYDPQDYLKLIDALEKTDCDAIYGSRYLVQSPRVIGKFFHTLMNKFLTLASNIFTNIDISDMETCYKLFRREVIHSIAPKLKENRFGFEPEVTSYLAHGKYRIGEVAISYHPRSYAEGKKITWLDGLRALYCILRYNASHAPALLQISVYSIVGFLSAIVDLVVFAILHINGAPLFISIGVAYIVAAGFNYLLCVSVLFKNNFGLKELFKYCTTFVLMWLLDYYVTWGLIEIGVNPIIAKALSIVVGFFGNFSLRKFWVFRHKTPYKSHSND